MGNLTVSDLAHFAILAPVPLEHLESGLEIVASQGEVAFGTMKWELFRRVDAERNGARVAVLIYPSGEDVPAKPSFIVSWFAWYRRTESSVMGAHPDGMKFRPPTTAKYPLDNKGHWAAFWHVSGFRELPNQKCLAIGKLKGAKGGWRKTAPPRGPELIILPESLSYEH
jgi:hypothetical protein